MNRLSLKFTHDKEIRRKEYLQPQPITFRNAIDVAYSLFPYLIGKPIYLVWVDDEGDKVACSSDEELHDALRIMKNRGVQVFHFTVKVDRSLRSFLLSFKTDKCFKRTSHPGVICNTCGMNPITGPRYQCTVRSNYNLCEKCEERSAKTYPMVKIYDPHQATNWVNGSFSDRTSNESSSVYHNEPGKAQNVPSIVLDNVQDYHSRIVEEKEGNGGVVQPGAVFRKVWKLKNTSEKPWPEGLLLVPFGESSLGSMDQKCSVPSLLPGCEADVAVEFTAPETPGEYFGSYRIQSAFGDYIGDTLTLSIVVSEQESDWDVVDQKLDCKTPPSQPAHTSSEEREKESTRTNPAQSESLDSSSDSLTNFSFPV